MNGSPLETIAALASANGPAARGIIRLSGPATLSVLGELLDDKDVTLDPLRPRRYPVRIPLREDGCSPPGSSDEIASSSLSLPADLFLWPTRRSFTGEPLAELHLIGSPPLLNEVLEMLFTRGARPAERGEFTLRAFLAGRIDLVQAEAVLGVIEASSSAELETALGQLAGGISGKIREFREQLLLHLADLEAGLDFVEEDIEFVQREELVRRLETAANFLRDLLMQSRDRMQSTGRAHVVLAGLPNAGKSTLFNRLIGMQAALVSTVAGTTRDYLSAPMQAEGVAWDLVDTAGWETARDGIEGLSGLLREEQYRQANVIVWCTPADLAAEEISLNARLLAECRLSSPHVIEIETKADLAGNSSFIPTAGRTLRQEGEIPRVRSRIRVSVTREAGIAALMKTIAEALSGEATVSEIVGSTAARCGESLQHALSGLIRARGLCDVSAGDELIALELRDVLDHLGRIVGEVYTDDILDRIFSRFCIGK